MIKRKILKSTNEAGGERNALWARKLRTYTDFSSETMPAGRRWNDIFKCWKTTGQTVPRILHSVKLSFKTLKCSKGIFQYTDTQTHQGIRGLERRTVRHADTQKSFRGTVCCSAEQRGAPKNADMEANAFRLVFTVFNRSLTVYIPASGCVTFLEVKYTTTTPGMTQGQGEYCLSPRHICEVGYYYSKVDSVKDVYSQF